MTLTHRTALVSLTAFSLVTLGACDPSGTSPDAGGLDAFVGTDSGPADSGAPHDAAADAGSTEAPDSGPEDGGVGDAGCESDSSCDDGNPCTSDVCLDGACVNDADDFATCEGGTCHAGLCCTGCWNGSACELGDAVTACGSAGADCQACPDDDNPCTDIACIEGSCGSADDDSNTCDDGNPCTDDACVSGTCTGVGDDTNTCADGTCHASSCCTGCWNGTTCETGSAPTACGAAGGACVACADDSLPCTDAACDAGVCTQVADDSNTCDDDVECTSTACMAGVCTAQPDDTQSCVGGTCHDGSCCTGCWDGGACLPGTSLTACGGAGQACDACTAPPPSTCRRDVRTDYVPWCATQACEYVPSTTACPAACREGACVPSYAMRVTSAGQRALVTSTAALFTPVFTVEAWASFDSLDVTDPMQMLLVAEAPGYRLLYVRAYAGHLECVIGNGAGFVSARLPAAAVTTGTLHHIACVRDASSTLTLWYDGSPVASTPAPTYLGPNGELLGLGGDYRTLPDAAASGFRGVIDEIRFSSVARYIGSTPFAPARRHAVDGSTLALWHFDEGTLLRASDASRYHRDAALVGGALWVPE